MTAVVAAALVLLAVADGAFAGFRSSAGRAGLISHRRSDYQAARRGAGLACYTVMNWRLRYLASALVLGPCTLLRPAVVIVGAAVGVAASRDPIVAASVVLSVIAVLAVEPLAARLWYTQAPEAAD